MIHTRSITICYVEHVDMEALRHWLNKAAETASVGIHIDTQPGPGYFSDCLRVKVDVWSGNEGSVDDCYRTLLSPLAWCGAKSVHALSLKYIDRVSRWCEGVNRFFEARRFSLQNFARSSGEAAICSKVHVPNFGTCPTSFRASCRKGSKVVKR